MGIVGQRDTPGARMRPGFAGRVGRRPSSAGSAAATMYEPARTTRKPRLSRLTASIAGGAARLNNAPAILATPKRKAVPDHSRAAFFVPPNNSRFSYLIKKWLTLILLVHPEGFEPPAPGFEVIGPLETPFISGGYSIANLEPPNCALILTPRNSIICRVIETDFH